MTTADSDSILEGTMGRVADNGGWDTEDQDWEFENGADPCTMQDMECRMNAVQIELSTFVHSAIAEAKKGLIEQNAAQFQSLEQELKEVKQQLEQEKTAKDALQAMLDARIEAVEIENDLQDQDQQDLGACLNTLSSAYQELVQELELAKDARIAQDSKIQQLQKQHAAGKVAAVALARAQGKETKGLAEAITLMDGDVGQLRAELEELGESVRAAKLIQSAMMHSLSSVDGKLDYIFNDVSKIEDMLDLSDEKEVPQQLSEIRQMWKMVQAHENQLRRSQDPTNLVKRVANVELDCNVSEANELEFIDWSVEVEDRFDSAKHKFASIDAKLDKLEQSANAQLAKTQLAQPAVEGSPALNRIAAFEQRLTRLSVAQSDNDKRISQRFSEVDERAKSTYDGLVDLVGWASEATEIINAE